MTASEEPSVFWAGRKGEPWDGFWFWNCGRPKCQEWIVAPSIGVAPRGRGAAMTEVRAEADMARHIEQYHPVRRRPRWWPWRERRIGWGHG